MFCSLCLLSPVLWITPHANLLLPQIVWSWSAICYYSPAAYPLLTGNPKRIGKITYMPYLHSEHNGVMQVRLWKERFMSLWNQNNTIWQLVQLFEELGKQECCFAVKAAITTLSNAKNTKVLKPLNTVVVVIFFLRRTMVEWPMSRTSLQSLTLSVSGSRLSIILQLVIKNMDMKHHDANSLLFIIIWLCFCSAHAKLL